jgi:hypothetical protein
VNGPFYSLGDDDEHASSIRSIISRQALMPPSPQTPQRGTLTVVVKPNFLLTQAEYEGMSYEHRQVMLRNRVTLSLRGAVVSHKAKCQADLAAWLGDNVTDLFYITGNDSSLSRTVSFMSQSDLTAFTLYWNGREYTS